MSGERPSSMDEKDISRLEAFRVGVFADAITLLVLAMKIPATFLDDPSL